MYTFIYLATLSSFIKEILFLQNIKSEKSLVDIIDKISTKYVTSKFRYINHISNIASKICTDKGKKTLNVDHVIEALTQMDFNNHIKLLTSELDLSQMKEDDVEGVLKSSTDMKELINKQKRPRKQKPKYEYNEDDINLQMELFEKSKMESLQQFMNSQSENYYEMEGGVKKRRIDQCEKDLFEKNKNDQELDFD
jgi:hypothetical protein